MRNSSEGGDEAGILSDVLGFTVLPPVRPLLDGAILTSGTRHIQAEQLMSHHLIRADRSHTYTAQCCSYTLVRMCRWSAEEQHKTPQSSE